MQQQLQVTDNYGNKGTLTFHLKGERAITVASVAMDFARMAGVMETLGNIPDNSYYRHKMDLYCWARNLYMIKRQKMLSFSLRKK